jgi:hypothetical protein
MIYLKSDGLLDDVLSNISGLGSFILCEDEPKKKIAVRLLMLPPSLPPSLPPFLLSLSVCD